MPCLDTVFANRLCGFPAAKRLPLISESFLLVGLRILSEGETYVAVCCSDALRSAKREAVLSLDGDIPMLAGRSARGWDVAEDMVDVLGLTCML